MASINKINGYNIAGSGVGIDTKRIIAKSVTSYTASEDCWCYVGTKVTNGGACTSLSLNGVSILGGGFWNNNTGSQVDGNYIFFMKAGDVISVSSARGVTIFGTK